LSAEVIANLRALGDATEPSLIRQIFMSFLNESVERIGILRNSLDGSDAGLLRKTAHALRGASGSVGARHMADIAQQLEALGKAGHMTGAVALIEQIEHEFDRVKTEIAALDMHSEPPSDRVQS
jgi:HPt (histidine-containing phosphotransfer) domain-containing protein